MGNHLYGQLQNYSDANILSLCLAEIFRQHAFMKAMKAIRLNYTFILSCGALLLNSE